VLSAIGTTAAVFDPDQVDVAINGVGICVGGAAGADRNLVDLTGRAVLIDVNLNAGGAQATVLTNDLSHGYVHENSAYSS
jgi:glutamate N-acetyltransferase/amino-acid N-acetyltransferase